MTAVEPGSREDHQEPARPGYVVPHYKSLLYHSYYTIGEDDSGDSLAFIATLKLSAKKFQTGRTTRQADEKGDSVRNRAAAAGGLGL